MPTSVVRVLFVGFHAKKHGAKFRIESRILIVFTRGLGGNEH